VQAIRPLTGSKIYLQPNGSRDKFWVQLIAPAAIHELRHVWQKKQKGLLSYSFQSVFGRLVYAVNPAKYESCSLEADAFEQQDKATDYIQKHCQ